MMKTRKMRRSMDKLLVSRQLPKRTMALVLAGGRGSRLQAADRPARQAGGVLRRQVPHHRFRAVELPQLGHPPHRRGHAVQVALADAPPAARLELPARRAQRDRRPAAGAAARRATSTGTAARPTRSTRTSTSSARYSPDYVVVLAGDHIYKMDYSLMLMDHVRARRRLHGRLHRGAAHGGHRLRRDGTSTTTAASPTSSRSRPTRRRMPGKPDVALASMGIYVFDAEYLYQLLEEDMADPDVEPRLRQGHHPARGGARAARWRTRSSMSCVPRRRTRRAHAVLARRRHDRCILGGQPRPGRRSRPSSTSTTRDWPIWTYQRAAAAGQVRARRATASTA